MIAMALGNVWGGRRADKDPNPDKLYVRLVVAAVWIAAIPLLGKYVILADLGRAGAHRKHKFPDLGGVSRLHGRSLYFRCFCWER